MGTTTPILGLYQPDNGETAWGDEVNGNLDILEARITGDHVNVRDFGAVGDNSTDDVPAFQAALDTGEDVYIPAGDYRFADGTGCTFETGGQRIFGAGRGKSRIWVIDAYAFTGPVTGNLSDVSFESFAVAIDGDSTSAGAIKAVSNDYMNGFRFFNLYVDCVGSDNLTPQLHLQGFIGGMIEFCRFANNAGNGIHVASAGFVSNSWQLAHSSVNVNGKAGAPYAGLLIDGGGSGASIGPMNDFESNRGYGIYIAGGGGGNYWIKENWFEANQNSDILSEDNHETIIDSNCFHEMSGEPGGTPHIKFTDSSPTRGNFHRVTNNLFFGSYGLEIESGVSHVTVDNNRGMAYFNSGESITQFGNGGNLEETWEMIGTTRQLRVADDSSVTDGGSIDNTILSVEGSEGYVNIHPTGHLEINTTTPPAGGTGANIDNHSMVLYVDTGNNDRPRMNLRGAGSFQAEYIAMDKGTTGVTFSTAASGSTPGTCVKKLPIYDKAGTLLGYIPIYDAIT